jgi:hypothetical protein
VTATATRVASDEGRGETAHAPLRTEWTRYVSVALFAALVAGLTIGWVRHTTGLFLPPDGAHYIADADAMLGDGVRGLRHPPGFPLLLALVRPFTGEADSFVWAMTISIGLLVISLNTLLRRWLPFGPSLIGAFAGSMVPIVAELFGWGGGATLLGTVMLIFTIGAMEDWVLRKGKRGFLVGACLGATALTHAFPFVVAAAAIGVRAVVLLVERRRVGSGWDPLGWKGMVSVAALSVPAFALAYPSYFGPGVSIGGWRPGLSWDLLVWALGDRWTVWLIAAAAAAGIVLSEHRGLIVYALFLTSTVGAFPAVLAGHVSYANRAEYLVPIVIALGIGSLASVIWRHLSRPRWWGRSLALALALVAGVVGLTTYLPRVERAAAYYDIWVTPRDVPLLESLQGDSGTVATSWRANDFSNGVALAWVVEALGKRPAIGSGDAFLAIVPGQFEDGVDVQRLFAGTEGLENGALQVAAGPLGTRTDMSVQVRSLGFNYPLLFVRSPVNSYPVEPRSATTSVFGDLLVWTFRDVSGGVVMERTASLAGEVVAVRYESTRVGDWWVELAPPFQGAWSSLSGRGSEVRGTIDVRGEVIPFSVRATGADIQPRIDGPDQGILVRTQDRSWFELRIWVDTSANPGELMTFDERNLLQEHDISNVLVLRNSRWMPRFDLDPCYVRAAESGRMVVYAVLPDRCPEASVR